MNSEMAGLLASSLKKQFSPEVWQQPVSFWSIFLSVTEKEIR